MKDVVTLLVLELLSHHREDIARVVLEGGPCSGKTTSLEMIKGRIIEMGMIPIVLHEIPTVLKKAGMHPKDFSDTDYQTEVFMAQLHQEVAATRMAVKLREKYGKRVVILCDRGLLSGAAYMSSDDYLADFQQKVLGSLGVSMDSLRVGYAAVAHLITAADGAEEFYTVENNESRDEGIEEARYFERRSQTVWLGDEVKRFPNRKPDGAPISFDDKILSCAQYVIEKLGKPFPVQRERRFIIGAFDPSKIAVPYEKIGMVQTYLETDGATEEWIRERTWLGTKSYSWAEKTPSSDGGQIKRSRNLDKNEYLFLLETRKSPLHLPLRKDRFSFLYNHAYIKIDQYQDDFPVVMEVYDDGPNMELPAFPIAKEVTGIHEYSNEHYARFLKIKNS